LIAPLERRKRDGPCRGCDERIEGCAAQALHSKRPNIWLLKCLSVLFNLAAPASPDRGTMQAESLQVKAYFADSVEEAIQAARRELGPDAVLITSRRAAPEVSSRGAYEVIFGTSPQATATVPQTQKHDLGREVSLLRDQLETIKRSIEKRASSFAQAPSEIDRIQQELLAAGLEETLIGRIIEDAWNSRNIETASSPDAAAELRSAVLESIRRKLRFAPEFSAVPKAAQRALVFVGPPGAGKTTSLAKIAMQECLGRQLSVRIISVDTHRAGAHEKLRSLARIMGFGFTAVNSMREFIESVTEFRAKDVLLIDTPGYCRNDLEIAADLIHFLKQMTPKEIHLALPACMNRDDLLLAMRRYDVFEPDYLLFTKLDATESRGAILSAALEANKPLSYLTAGQSIPEDIERASEKTLLGRLFPREKTATLSAA